MLTVIDVGSYQFYCDKIKIIKLLAIKTQSEFLEVFVLKMLRLVTGTDWFHNTINTKNKRKLLIDLCFDDNGRTTQNY